MLQTLFMIPIALFLLALFAFLIFNLFMTWRTQTAPEQDQFLAGKLPEAPLDGFYKGTATMAFSWMGKKFSAAEKSGVNVLKSGEETVEKFPFKTENAKGYMETGLDVLRIRYDLPANPWWVRVITDELVQVGPNRFLGKIHARPLPGVSFLLGYFWLEKPASEAQVSA